MRVSSRNGALVKEVLSPRPATSDPRLIWHIAEKKHRQRAAIAVAVWTLLGLVGLATILSGLVALSTR
jgi:hypothetical protein